MSQIRDEVKRDVPTRPHVARSLVDVQRLKLEKLMKNHEKPIIIPEKPKERGPPAVPDFVRNVMGSSAGAGSGEFHVYRHLRRKEYARQHYMHKRAEWERLEDEYHEKIEENKRKAEEDTARKRAKRLKKKKNRKRGGGQKPTQKEESSSEDDAEVDPKEQPVEASSEAVAPASEEATEQKPNEDVATSNEDVAKSNEDVAKPDESKEGPSDKADEEGA